jgi:NhaP-type Na+/H+ or K+/H+ antiporter
MSDETLPQQRLSLPILIPTVLIGTLIPGAILMFSLGAAPWLWAILLGANVLVVGAAVVASRMR